MGTIHIDPKNKGKFNALKKRTGKTTEELTHSKNPLTRKRAVFALNASKWKHEFGGYAQEGYKVPRYTPSESTSTRINTGQTDKRKITGKSPGANAKDSFGENLFEMVDPTGISSWDDVARAWSDGKFNSSDIVEPITAIPIVGKLGKISQGLKIGDEIYRAGSLVKLLKGLNIEEGAEDVYQDNYKKEYGGMAASDNVDMGYYSNPLKYFAAMGINISDNNCLECGGKIKANKGINIENTWDNLRSKLSKKDQVKFEEWKSNLPDRLQNDKDYDLKGFFKEFGKNSLPEGYEYHLIDKYKLPNHPSFSSDSQYYNPETEYLGGKWDNGILNWIYTPNTQFKNKIIEPKSMDEVRNDFLRENHNILSRNPNVFKKFGGEVLPMDSYIKNSNESTDVLIKLNDFKERVPEYIYKGYLMSGKDGIYKGVDKNKFDVIQRTLSDGTITYLPYTYNNVQDNSKDFNSLQNKLSSVQIGVNQHKFGGNIKEEYYSNIKPINYYLKNGGFIKPGYRHIADEGFPNGQELTQPTTNYYNWGNYGNQNSFLTLDQINQKPFENPYQNMNLQQPNVPQFNIPKGQEIEPLTSIGAQKMTPDLQGIRNRVNQSMQDIAPKSKSPMNMNAVSMGLDIGGKSLDATANLLGSLGKDNSKAQAFGQGASGAMNVASQVTAPFKDIPIAGKAIEAVGGALGFFIGGALEARRQGIENEEMDKYNKLQEYTSRNTQTAQQPSYYEQYMSKYGSNIKNLEQRLVDDIFSDYDKFMKLT